jgi:hypothetical protein
VRLISRVFSFVGAETNGEPWTAIGDFDLSCFAELQRLYAKRIVAVAEAILVHEFLSNRVPNPLIAVEAKRRMALFQSNNTALGIAIKLLLQGNTMEQVKAALPNCPSIPRDLARGWEFWQQMRVMHGVMARYNAMKEPIANQYKNAEQVLQDCLTRHNII